MHSRSRDRTGRHKSRHRKKPERCALTFWRPHRKIQVMTETNRQSEAHSQTETARRGTSQDTESNRQSEAYSRPGDHIERNKSGQGKKPPDGGALTLWRPHREERVNTRKEADRARHTYILETSQGQVRTRKETDRARRTHVLEITQGGTS